MIWMIISSLLAALAGLALYIYYWRKGHFENDEIVKYQLFHEDNEES